MEMSQGNSLHSYLKQTFFFPKNEEQEVLSVQNRPCLRVDTSGSGDDVRKKCRRVNVVEILCTHV
jgi:hypothetical protein